MAYDTGFVSDELPDDEDFDDSRVELNCAAPDPEYPAPPLQRLPADPHRSLGGFLNYAGWPGCERLMELDKEIQSRAQKQIEHVDDSENSASPHRDHRRSAGRVDGTARAVETGSNQQTSVRKVRSAGADRLTEIWSEYCKT